ncbi:7685_t:CDS:2 [Funneliformis geosporum]|uniref:4550_t:CDS:1 n=1 Tax=Funneliformis geosporum TaxID=1117311 RepID=A0A9W4SX01_9GLOM|nr:7685_t:CDS:2 [Funneliformis geosporum]CAI2183951.1 4550_t:CDS:2 [Funneliformis geosporum]
MAATIHNDQLQTPQHPQHQHVQQQSARNRPVSTPVPINYPRYPDNIQQPPPPIPQSSVRRGNMFGPYLLLQTLGEGEFGKVKLGMHVDTGEEVAIKLIRKESVDTPSRLTKIEREIGVLRGVMHPNIVKLYDVFETDRYIGIIMEYASGGELFDHILAHRYLKERDACRLFAQLISGVNYLHQKNIVHRDLKLENLLLDRNRNIIITDFGFANQFNGVHDDLMATSCGSPCYAAPELVISEGLYVGSAVDIWSCGVILYAMLSGYLPFDDDPQNPDGDNINLLYKYIINTPLVFPDYVSPDARDLLRKMLVPDPAKRCDMKIIMSHRWLTPYSSIFDYTIQELEAAANPVPSLVPPESYLPSGISSSNSYLTADYIAEQPSTTPVSTVPSVKRHTIQVEYDYPDNTVGYADYPDEDFLFVDGTRLGANPLPTATSDMILPEEQAEEILHNNKINVSANSQDLNSISEKHHSTTPDKSNGISTPSGNPLTNLTSKTSANAGNGLFTLFESDSKNNKRGEKIRVNNVKNNLTVPSNGQLEPQHVEIQKSTSQTPKKRDAPRTRPVTVHGPPSSSQNFALAPSQKKNSNSTNKQSNNHRSDITSTKIHTLSPISTPPSVPLPPIPGRRESLPPVLPPNISNGQKKHRRGLSSEKIFKFLGNGNGTTPVSVDTSNIKKEHDTLSPTTPQISQPVQLPVNHDMPSDTASDSTSAIDDISESKSKRRPSKRKALSLMVDTLKGPASQSTHSVVSGSNVPVKDKRKVATGTSAGSSNAAKKVMDWFRRKSLAKQDELLNETGHEPAKSEQTDNDLSSRRPKSKSKRQKNNPSVVVTQPSSNVNNSSSSRLSMITSANINVDSKLRAHHGAVDQLALTSRAPYEVFIVVKQTLVSMGIEIKREGDFKVRCIRRKRKVIDNGKPVGKETFRGQKNKEKDSLVTLENSEGIIDLLAEKKRRKYSTGPLKTLLRRTSSNNTNQLASSTSTSTSSLAHSNKSNLPTNVTNDALSVPMSSTKGNGNTNNGGLPSVPNSPTFGPVMTVTSPNDGTPLPINNHSNSILTTPEILYGDPTVDSGEEIRFAVELCRIKNLPGLYIVDIKRMKGNLWGYKFLYHTLLDKLDLKGKGGYLTIGTSGGFIP